MLQIYRFPVPTLVKRLNQSRPCIDADTEEPLEALEYTYRVGVKELSNRRRYDRGPREMHKAICSDCGKECEVPFKPTEGRPVYCQECYQKHRPPRRRY